jgi:hypothetical protein
MRRPAGHRGRPADKISPDKNDELHERRRAVTAIPPERALRLADGLTLRRLARGPPFGRASRRGHGREHLDREENQPVPLGDRHPKDV